MGDTKTTALSVIRLVAFLGLITGMTDLLFGLLSDWPRRQPVWVTIVCVVVYFSIRAYEAGPSREAKSTPRTP
jgi:hypothetical protein